MSGDVTITRKRLLDAALDLFSRRWYESVSVAEICRHAGLSNGIFYTYFRHKEAIFRVLVETFIDRLEEDLSSIRNADESSMLSDFLKTIVTAGTTSEKLLTIFREGQYRYPEYELRLRKIYVRTLCRVLGREIGLSEYLYCTSGVRFLINRAIQTGKAVNIDQLISIVQDGVFTVPLIHTDMIFQKPVMDTPEFRDPFHESESTRNRLLSSGIRLFGDKGVYHVNVYEIARDAGFSVGTFYIYFPGKEAFLEEIVQIIGRSTRHFITVNLNPVLNRLESELQGMCLFLHHFSRNRQYYEIVREAEFIVPSAVREYYDRFEAGYKDNLRDLKDYDLYTLANTLIGISHYLGIEILYTAESLDQEKIVRELGRFLVTGIG